MGSTGAFLETGGFTEKKWTEIGKMHGVKIIKKTNANNADQSLPPFSNTPGTAYILLDKKGRFKQYRQYKEDRSIDFDVDNGRHNNENSLHIHYGRGDNAKTIVIARGGTIVNQKLYNRFKIFLKGVKP